MLFSSATKIGAMCAITGSLMVFLGTFLHPMRADPSNAVAAFAEYAADGLWVTSHLIQLLGIILIVAALLFLAQQLESKRGARWTRIAAAGAIASMAAAAALQAVDGIALKSMVDTWAAATAAQREAAFYAAFAVRQVEIGLASVLSCLFGLTATVYGIALLSDRTYSQWLGVVAIVAGVSAIVAGIAMAFTGFSGFAMAISMPAGSLLLLWMLALGICMWRRSEVPSQR
jgi:hypothetical protein